MSYMKIRFSTYLLDIVKNATENTEISEFNEERQNSRAAGCDDIANKKCSAVLSFCFLCALRDLCG
jgi:hypothetical protein